MKDKKKKKKKKDLFTKTKRVNKTTKRVHKKEKSPYSIVIRNWADPLAEHKEMELNEDSKLEFHINGKSYSVSINKKNNCLEFGTHETHLYLQPVSVKTFLVKSNTPKKK